MKSFGYKSGYLLSPMISASPRRLTVFKSVVERGGFNAAATQLGIAQPSVGAHIRALEVQVGQPLFVRQRGSRPRLTKAGEALYAFAIDLLRRTEEAAHALDDLRKLGTDEVAVAVHRDLMSDHGSAWLAAFAERHPTARVVTRLGTIEDVIALIRERSVALGLFLSAGQPEGVRSEVLMHEPLLLVVSMRHPLAARACLSAEEIGRQRFVCGLRGSRYRAMADAALRSIGIEGYDIAMELQESTAVKEMVRHGIGIACLPLCTVHADLTAGTLVALDLAHSLPPLELRCGYAAPLSLAARQFVTSIRAQC
ncbi:MAG: LysR family transcriptional regulator [Hyphomicrobiales bacterium]|nr:LysR family transcriptional regulator [Hyphomicrobiales bacterium]